MPRKKNKQVKEVAESSSHYATPPRAQPPLLSATLETPPRFGGDALPGYEVEMDFLDEETGMMVGLTREELVEKGRELAMTLPNWFDAWVQIQVEKHMAGKRMVTLDSYNELYEAAEKTRKDAWLDINDLQGEIVKLRKRRPEQVHVGLQTAPVQTSNGNTQTSTTRV